MNSWVVTGGVGTGKSSFCEHLSKLGGAAVRFYSCDVQVRELLGSQAVGKAVVERLGRTAIDMETGAVDRRKVREIVFADSSKKKALEDILHPLVLEELEHQRQVAESIPETKVFVAEVPLYHEIGESVKTDKVIVVAASEAVQRSRLMENRQLDEPTTERMLDAQLPMTEKVSRADVVVWNDGSPAMLEAQALALLGDHL
jgi:dephospho-CoA kinase